MENRRSIENGHHLFNIIKGNPDLIPRKASPSTVFFLLSLQSFELAVRQWLGYTLDDKGFDVRIHYISFYSPSNGNSLIGNGLQ